MYCTRRINDDYTWVGADGRRLAMFEGVFDVPAGISFNSYLLRDEKTVLFDTTDAAVRRTFGVKISCDLNYRGKLWTREQARAAMTDLCQYVDVCISNEEDAKDVFGIEAEATDIYAGEINREGYKSVAKQLADKFGFEKVAITLRESHSASDNGWSAMLYDVASNEYCFSKK